MNEIIERNGKRYRVRIERDEDMGEPWKEHADECKAIQPALSGTGSSGCHANCPVAKAKGGA